MKTCHEHDYQSPAFTNKPCPKCKVYETVEEKVQVGIYSDGSYVVAPKTWSTEHELVEATLTFKREIKPKVKRREEIPKVAIGGGYLDILHDVRYFAEWEE